MGSLSVSCYILALIVAEVAAQPTPAPTDGSIRWNQVCDDSLVACDKTYMDNPRNKTSTNTYYDCVFKVFCERWSEGYYKRQDMLGRITARKEFYDPEAGDWWANEACSHHRSLSIMAIPVFAFLYILYTLSLW